MTTILQFDKANLSGLRAEIQAALSAVAAANGISLQLGSISFDAGSFSAPVKGACEAKGSKDLALAESFARAIGFDISKPSPDGFTVVRYNTRSSKKPWVITKGGKEYLAGDGWMRQRFPAHANPIAAKLANDLIASGH